jgi:hypothetical protein
MGNPAKVESLRRQALGAIVLICVQAGLGMFVNLFVTIPTNHAGSNPREFFSGSTRSVLWAIAHGAVALTLHVVLGLLLAVMVIGVVAGAIGARRRALLVWSILGAMGTIGAGFTGAGFLDFNQDVSSFFMSILALGSLLCFVVVVFLPRHVVSPEVAAVVIERRTD